MFSKEYIIKSIELSTELYSCNRKKNTLCKANNCCDKGGPCSHTSDWKYAKRTPLNYIKRVINKIRGK